MYDKKGVEMPRDLPVQELLLQCEQLFRRGVESIRVAADLNVVEQACINHYLALVELVGQLVAEIQTPGSVSPEKAKDQIVERLLGIDQEFSVVAAAVKRSKELVRTSLRALPERSRAFFLLERAEEWLILEERIILAGDLFVAYVFDFTKVQPVVEIAFEEYGELRSHTSLKWVSRMLEGTEKRLDHVKRLRDTTSERLGHFSLLNSLFSFASQPRNPQ